MTRIGYISCIFLALLFNNCVSTEKGNSPNTQMATRPSNIILMIGDGMGLSQISAALYSNNNHLAIENLPVIGFQKTHSGTDLITDSAAAGTAMSSGVKTCNNCIGIDIDSVNCISIAAEAYEKGWATGLVVTSSILHATPAAFYAHEAMRFSYEDIAVDLVEANIDFFVGGGRKFMIKRDGDKRNLYKELKKKNYRVLDYTFQEIDWMSTKPNKKIAYFTAEDRPRSVIEGRNYLAKATEKSLEYLTKKSEGKGFFLMIEGSQIDWACHAKKGNKAIAETLNFDKTIEIVLEYARKKGNTLVIVTADHETGGMSINEGSEINKLKTAFTTNGHTASMVPVFAYGPMAEKFAGIYDNTAIYVKMKEAFGW